MINASSPIKFPFHILSIVFLARCLKSSDAFTLNTKVIVPLSTTRTSARTRSCSRSNDAMKLYGFFDDFMKENFGGGSANADANANAAEREDEGTDKMLNEADFRSEVLRRNDEVENTSTKNAASNLMTADSEDEEEVEFDGYMLRDAIFNKWGQCFDLEFQPVTTYGFKNVYLNVMPFRLGGKRFRHKTELDYLCHLQAVVEILEKYDQLEYVLTQLEETNKKPRAGTSPLVAVPFRLDLTEDELESILN